MIKNYFKIALRNLKKNKAFSFINIFGLAIGLTCFMFIAVFVYNELSYDTYPINAKNIYRVTVSVTGNGDVVVYPNVDNAVGEGIKDAFPEVKAFTRFSPAQDFYPGDMVGHAQLAAGFCLQDQHQCMGICHCRFHRDIDCFTNRKFLGDKSRGGKPGEEFKK